MVLQCIVSELLETPDVFIKIETLYNEVSSILDKGEQLDFNWAYNALDKINRNIQEGRDDQVHVKILSASIKAAKAFYNISTSDDYFI